MKTGHIADLHHNPERNKRVLYVLDQVKELAPDLSLFTNSGENFHNPYNFTERSGFNDLLSAWDEITSIVPVATIRGTQGKHERPGMVETLRRAGVTILEPGTHYFLGRNGLLTPVITESPDMVEASALQIFGVPHAHKAHILASNDKLSREEANQAVNNAMRNVYARYGAMRAEYPDVPALAVGHGVVSGKNTRAIPALKASAIYSTEADLQSMGCDYYAWGHYHNPTDFETIRGGYLGSFAWDFNECDYIPAITIVDWDTMTVSRHNLQINMRKTFHMHPGEPLPDMTGCDVHVVNNETEWTEADCKDKGAGLVKVTTEIETENKVRSAEVVSARSYPDKFKAVYPDATEREMSVCEEFWEMDISQGMVPTEKVFTPLWLEIKGSKAFMERSGKEVVRIDYSSLADGLTMLVGPGGAGKSALFDLASPFSVLFLQANTLISTFELDESYVKQGWMINDVEYRIEKLFKPALKTPKAEYYAFCGDTPISGLSGNRAPFDEWCISMFGSPRKYASFVLNTQFDDNTSKFMGQPINPSIFQATNIELKALFHELAGTDLKHLELRCKEKAKEYQAIKESEQVKKEGAEERLPDIDSLVAARDEIGRRADSARVTLSEANRTVADLQVKLDAQDEIAEKNRGTKAVIDTLTSKLSDEKSTLESLNSELATAGSLDIEALGNELAEMEVSKFSYDAKLKALPLVQQQNATKRQAYDDAVAAREATNAEIRDANAAIDEAVANKALWREKKSAAESAIDRLRADAKRKAEEETEKALGDYRANRSEMEAKKTLLGERVSNGKEMISAIKPCTNCGHIEPDDNAKKARYQDAIEGFRREIQNIDESLAAMQPPPPVPPAPVDTSPHDAVIRESVSFLNAVISGKTALLPVVEAPSYQDETIPVFDSGRYQEIKTLLSSTSDDRVKDLNRKISDVSARINALENEISGELAKIVPEDDSVRISFRTAEEASALARSELHAIEGQGIAAETRITEAVKARDALSDYDRKIEEAHAEWAFWDDMRIKWGPTGIPARILEHTGPYVDSLANDLLSRFYPIYKVHSQTTKMSSDGKQELEVFTISVINQETGREKPINALSGEERQFVNEALRYAFRTLNRQNSLESWTVTMEDEPDSHVSEGLLMSFWDMVEASTRDRAFCISHSPEIKHRSQVTIDITSL